MNQTNLQNHHGTLKGIKSTLLGIIANLFLALVKATAGVIGNTYVLIADAIESSMDIVSSLIVFGGLKIASAPPDEKHPYGHGKAESIAAIIVSLALIGAALMIAFKSYKEIITPHSSPAPWTLLILILVILMKASLFKYVTGVGHEIGSTAVRTDAWHHMSDALTSIAAFIGISISLLFGKYGLSTADDWATLFMTVIILYNGYRLLRPALDEIMDAAVPKDINDEIRNIAQSIDGVVITEKCLVRKAGLGYFVDLHLHVRGDITVSKGHDIAHAVKDALLASKYHIFDVIVHVEPADKNSD